MRSGGVAPFKAKKILAVLVRDGEGFGLARPLAFAQGERIGRRCDALDQACPDSVDHELSGERGEQHAEQARDHRLDLLPHDPHQRAGQQAARRASAAGSRPSPRGSPAFARCRARCDISSITEAIDPGPAIIGIAIGKTETSSTLRRVDDLLRAVLAALGALFEHHFERDQEQHDAARDAEAIEADAERVEQYPRRTARRRTGSRRRRTPRGSPSRERARAVAPAVSPA